MGRNEEFAGGARGPAEEAGIAGDIVQANTYPPGGWTEDETQAKFRPMLNPKVTDPDLKATYAEASEAPLSNRGAGFIADTLASLQRANIRTAELKKRQAHVNKLMKSGMSQDQAIEQMHSHWRESGKLEAYQQRLRGL